MDTEKKATNDIEKQAGRLRRSGSLSEQIDGLLGKVEKPARYIGGEMGVVHKPDDEIKTRFVFAFPDTYEIGMSYLGMEIIYSLLNGQPGVQCERVFAPAPDMEAEMRRAGIPLFSLESKKPVRYADILGFTLQYELSYSNVINMLDLAGIPFLSEARGRDFPLLMAGGPCSFNAEPLADVFDIIFVGDSEESLPKILDAYEVWASQDTDKTEFFKSVAGIEGVYIPSFYKHEYDETGKLVGIVKANEAAPDAVRKALVQNLDKAPFPKGGIVPFIEVVHDRASIEIFRGCTRGCRFCQAGMIYRPVRERSMSRIKEISRSQIENSGYEEMSLLSLSTSDYSQIEDLVTGLMQFCKAGHVALSVPSLRLDSFSFKMLEEIQGYKKSGLTFAPEAGTQRLRDVINKSITDEDIDGAVRQAISLGWTSVKLYFMIGLPTEEEADLDGIAQIARRIMDIYYQSRKAGSAKGGRFQVTVSVSNFVPKPHTPFQWVGQNHPEVFHEKHMYLKEKFRGMKNVKFTYHDNKTSYLEGVFARGDRRLLAVIIRAFERGCKFDGWGEFFRYDEWMKAFEEAGIDPQAYALRERDYEENLPWDIIDSGVKKEFLIRENEAALAQTQTPDCRKQCLGCGVNGRAVCHA